MATSWGGWTGAINGQQFRVGIDLSVSGTTITAKYYIQCTAPVGDNMTLTMTGGASGSVGFYMGSTGPIQITSRTKTGSRGSSYAFGAKVTGIYNGASPSVTASVTIPATTPSKPAKPSLSSPSSSGFKASLESAPSNGGAAIDRYAWNAEGQGGIYSSGTSRSYKFEGLSANTSYRVRVRAENSAGAGPWSDWSSAITTAPEGPNAPTDVAVARVSDTQQTITWAATASTAKPVTNCRVLRSDNINGTIVTVATVAGTVRSYIDTTTVANRRYEYWVETVNSAGATRSVSSAAINTTPASPVAPQASRQGTTVKLVFTVNTLWPDTVAQYVIEDNPGGSGWVTLTTITKTDVWVHQNPDLQVTHQYRFSARTSANMLTSAPSPATPVVQLLAPPAAPGNLKPNGEGIPLGEALTLSFTHNPIDSSDATKAQIRWRILGASEWTTPAAFDVTNIEAGDTLTYVLDTSSFTSGDRIEWQASTWGGHADQGAWSVSAISTISQRPTVTIETPTDTWGYPKLTVLWGYFDTEETTQSRAVAVLEDENGIIETRTINGSGAQTVFTQIVANGGQYTLTVTVWDGHNLASHPAIIDFVVDYLPPATPSLVAEFDRDTGATVLGIENPEDDSLPEAVLNDIQRRNGTGPWVTILSGLPINSTVADFTMPLGQDVEYRAVAWSQTPSSAISDPQALTAGIGEADAYLGGGPGFSHTVRLRRNPETSGQTGLAGKVLHQFAGRTKPTGFDGVMTAREVTWSGSLLTEEQSLSEFEAIAILQGQHLLRTPDGIWIAGQLDAIPYQRGVAGAIWGVSVKITETAGAN